MPKTFKELWAGKDWAGPIVELLHTAFLLLLDAIQILALFGIAEGLEKLLKYLHIKPITIYGQDYGATDIIKNFDYMLLIMFLVALVWRFGKLLKESLSD